MREVSLSCNKCGGATTVKILDPDARLVTTECACGAVLLGTCESEPPPLGISVCDEIKMKDGLV